MQQNHSINIPEIVMIPLSKLVLREDNPNEQSDETFNNVVRSIQENGFLEPLWVAKGVYDKSTDSIIDNEMFEVISGAHRYKGAVTLAMDAVPCYVLPDMDIKRRIALLVGANAMRGKINDKKMHKLIEYYMTNGWATDLAYQFYTETKEFQKWYKPFRDSLPKEIKDRLPETAEEIKTVDQLAKILNRMFTLYGDTLPYSYMIFDYGGKDSIWIKCDKDLWKKLTLIRTFCSENEKDINEVIQQVFQTSSYFIGELESGKITSEEN